MAGKKSETKTVVKKKYNYPTIGYESGNLFVDDDEKKSYTSKALGDALEYFRAPMVQNDEEFVDRAEDYFKRCVERGIRPTWEEFSLAMGTTRFTLWDWEHERYHPRVSPDLIKKAKEFIAAYDAKAVSDGKLNPVAYIFRSKNYYGLKDQQEHILTPNTGDAVDKQRLIEEAELLPDE